jgi:CubicO group peptidase (beta-lactamase class C family)/dienelactone hydrolase
MLAVLLTATALDAQAAPAQGAAREIPLYPGAAPGSEKWDWSERRSTNPRGMPMVSDVVRPVLLHYPAEKGKAVGTAMVVAPGGGFRVLMMSYEGEDIARRLNAMGIDAFVLKYRLIHAGPGAPARQDAIKLAYDDGRQAVRVVRERAGEFGYRPDRVGMIGFSAGGMVTSEALFGPAATRPDFAAIIYGVGQVKEPPSPAPPLFLAAAADDTNAAGRSVEQFTAYRKGKGLAELHIFQMGAHGFVNKGGGADHFMDRLEEWLAVNKLLSKPADAGAAPKASPRPAPGGAAAPTGAGLPRSSPEEQGVSSSAVLSFLDAADRIDSMNSVMLVRHGHVIAEGWWAPYDAGSPHSLYSLSKSFTSTAVGLAVAEGKLSLDDAVLKFFPDDAPAEPSRNLKAMRVRDLLRMNTGQQTEPARTAAQSWTRSFLAQPVPLKPGTHFLYNTSGTYMLSAIVQKATGQTVLDYLRPRLFEPLGIERPTWEASPQGISAGGYGLSIRTEDIAKFGQLYLRKGKWEGKQLVPASWVEAATRLQTSNGSSPDSDWDQGYGYQFWRCRHGAYRGDGAFGQFCIVLPEQDAVVAITSGVRDMQAVLNLVWDHLLPALKPATLAADSSAQERLRRRLEGLTLRPQEGSASAPSAARVSGRKYEFPANGQKLEVLTLEEGGQDGAVTLVVRSNGTEQRIACGRGAWRKGRGALGQLPTQPVAASGAWTGDDTFAAKLCFYETPFIFTARLTFSGDEVRCAVESNVGFGRVKQEPLVGKAK